MGYRLIVTDIDGTLVGNHSQTVSPRTREVLGRLDALGIPVVLCTARPPRAIRSLWQSLDLSAPVIAYNGALVFDPGSERILLHHPVPTPVALSVMEAILAVDPGAHIGLEMADDWYVSHIDDRLRGLIESGWVPHPPRTGDLVRVVSSSDRGVSKIYMVAPRSVREQVVAQLEATGLRDQVMLTSSDRDFLEISGRGVHKGAALRALAAILGVSPAETLAVGDGLNDLLLLQAAGLGVAMGNAPNEVKQVAGAVTGTCSEDGWAAAVERWVLVG